MAITNKRACSREITSELAVEGVSSELRTVKERLLLEGVLEKYRQRKMQLPTKVMIQKTFSCVKNYID